MKQLSMISFQFFDLKTLFYFGECWDINAGLQSVHDAGVCTADTHLRSRVVTLCTNTHISLKELVFRAMKTSEGYSDSFCVWCLR